MRLFLRPHIAMSALVAAVALAATAGSGCGSAPAPVAAPKETHKASSTFDPCKDSPPAKRQYFGILKHIKCDQDLYLTMADVAGDLDVQCEYCHAADKGGDPKKLDFPAMTEKKQIALFMDHYFIDGLRQKDGKPMQCGSCHVDKDGKPKAKFLGEPRDIAYTLEWMNLVMTNKFVHTDGSKVKCKDCHVGNYKTPEFQAKVIMQPNQVQLPNVLPFQRFPDNPPGEYVMFPPVKPAAKPAVPPPTSQWWKKKPPQ